MAQDGAANRSPLRTILSIVVIIIIPLLIGLYIAPRVVPAPKIGIIRLYYDINPVTAFEFREQLDYARNDPSIDAVVLVVNSPGGTASNVVCYLAKGNVALSITLTAVSTLLSVLLTPLLCWLYMDVSIQVPVWPMLLSILKIVFAPVLLGILLNHYFHAALRPLQHLFPLISVVAIVWIIAIIVALNQPRFTELGVVLVVAVMLHNAFGLLGGYAIGRGLGYDKVTSRTLAIEVGMQNSGLAVALAVKFFSPVAALPGALFSVWHNLSGSLLAAVWRRTSPADP